MTSLSMKPGKQREGTPDVPESLRNHERRLIEAARPWSLDLKCERTLSIEHTSYQRWVDETFPESLSLPTFPPDADVRKVVERGLKIGRNSYARSFTPSMVYSADLQYIGPLPIMRPACWKLCTTPLIQRGRVVGKAWFTSGVFVPVLFTPDAEPWMSPTPSEVISQRPGIRAARGEVLIGGLGMGWFAREVWKKKNVKRVTVVERDPDIAAYFGEQFRHRANIRVVVDDAYEAAKSVGADAILFDIWKLANDAAWCDRWQKFKAEHKARGVRVWGWGDHALRD